MNMRRTMGVVITGCALTVSLVGCGSQTKVYPAPTPENTGEKSVTTQQQSGNTSANTGSGVWKETRP